VKYCGGVNVVCMCGERWMDEIVDRGQRVGSFDVEYGQDAGHELV